MKIVLLSAGLLLAGCDPAPNTAAAGNRSGESVSLVDEETITLEEYSQLSTGMSYEDAVKVIGFAGTEQSSSDIAGMRTVMYAWANPGGMQNMNAMFQDGKLVTKAQFGLQ